MWFPHDVTVYERDDDMQVYNGVPLALREPFGNHISFQHTISTTTAISFFQVSRKEVSIFITV